MPRGETKRVGTMAVLLALGCNPAGGEDESGSSGGPPASTSTAVMTSTDGTTGPGGSTGTTGGDGTGTTAGDSTGDPDGGVLYDVGNMDVPTSCVSCSPDYHEVITCDGVVLETCPDDQACDVLIQGCADACQAAGDNQASVGCEYWATKMDHPSNYDALGLCFAVFVANTWTSPVHIEVEYEGNLLPTESFTRIPSGAGPATVLGPYDPVMGLPPNEVAVLFLSGPTGAPQYGKVPCPIEPAVAPEVMIPGTGIGSSFRVSTDLPVVAYQMNPYGAGTGGAIAGASLLLPTSAWDTNYIATMAYGPDLSGEDPSMNVVATQDGTMVTLLPNGNVLGGGGIPAGPANVPLQFQLDRGEHAQISQSPELTGSVLQASAPVGLMAGHNSLRVPTGVHYADHAEQMIPPIRSCIARAGPSPRCGA